MRLSSTVAGGGSKGPNQIIFVSSSQNNPSPASQTAAFSHCLKGIVVTVVALIQMITHSKAQAWRGESIKIGFVSAVKAQGRGKSCFFSSFDLIETINKLLKG